TSTSLFPYTTLFRSPERAKRLMTDNCLRTSLRFMVTPKMKEGESGGRRDPCEQHTGRDARSVPIFGVRKGERSCGSKPEERKFRSEEHTSELQSREN